MFVRKTISTLFAVILATGNVGKAQRTYTYIETVGEGYEHQTIQGAIDGMNEHNNPPLGPEVLGCIEVYPGTYEHDAGPSPINPNKDATKWLPHYCDLRGMGETRESVIIQYPLSGGDTNYYIMIGHGDNQVYHLKLYTNRGTIMGIYLQDDSVLTDCIVDTIHGVVEGLENLVVTNCQLWSMFGSCIAALETFTISDCELHPRVRTWGIEAPCGIFAEGTGTIERVIITASGASSYDSAGAGLFGIILQLDAGEEVSISNVDIDLQLTSKYKANESATLRVCGILSGSWWNCPWGDVNHRGKAVVRDCTIDVTGIEEDGTGENDGADIMLDGVCVRGGGTVEVYGCSTITTSWTPAGDEGDGHEYQLNEDDDEDFCGNGGTIGASFPGIQFDPTGDQYFYPSRGAIGKLWGIGFRIEDDSGDVMAVFDYCGNLLLNGILTDWQTWPSATMDDEFIVQNSNGNNLAVISAADGDMFIHGEVKRESDNEWDDPDAGQDEFIIYDKEGLPVAYIDESGNVYLKGGLFEQW